MNKSTAKDALDLHLSRKEIDPDTDLEMREFSHQLRIAEMICTARKAAGLTQDQLAQAIGTKQQVISQLESADYEGHSLSMLERIAKALHRRVEIQLVPDEARPVAS